MPKFKDLSDQRFGRLLVIERGPNQGNRTRWLVHCDCGEEKLVQSNHLISGRQVSCGCNRDEKSRQSKNVKHGYNTAEVKRQVGTLYRSLWNNYGLEAWQFIAMQEAQNGVCAICRETPTLSSRGWPLWNVDHDHSCCPTKGKSCGKCVRGLLCTPCNQGLGMFRDDPARLRNALSYLGVEAQ